MAANYIESLVIYNNAKTAVEALRLPNAPATALFELVKLYDAPDVDNAFADLLVARQKRLCFLIAGAHSYVNERVGEQLQTTKRVEFALLICDTDRKTGQQAVFGGGGTLGIIALQEIVVGALAGAQLGLQHVALEPGDGDDFTAFDETLQSDSGRKGWFQRFATAAGRKVVPLKRLSGS